MITLRQLMEQCQPAQPAPSFEARVAGVEVQVQWVGERTAVVHPPGLSWPHGRELVKLDLVEVRPEQVPWLQVQRGWNGKPKADIPPPQYTICGRCGRKTQGAGICRDCQMICPNCGRRKSRSAKTCIGCNKAARGHVSTPGGSPSG